MGTFINSIVVLLVCGVFGAVTDDELVSVIEGEAVTLHTEVTKLQKSDKIRWRFEEGSIAKLIVEMTGGSIIYKDVDDGRFKDRLQILDLQTGDLIIKNMRHKHTGRYKADFENTFGTTTKIFRVTVKDAPRVIDAEQSDVKSVSVTEGDPVTLHTEVQTQRGDLILWRFGDKSVLIAKGDEENNRSLTYDDDERFRGRLKLDQSGSLTITNTKTTDAGVYKLQIINNRETKNKIFSVNVSERGLSAGEKTGIIIGALLAAAAVVVYVVVFYYRHKNYKHQKLQVQEMTVFEKSSLTLDTGVELQSGDEIQWSFRDEEIFTIKNNMIFIDERFRGRLEVDSRTGSLIIPNIRIQDSGLYKVKISSSSKVKSFLQIITGGGPTYSQCNVIVTARREENESVTLCTGITLQPNDEIQWTFKKTLIAQIKNNTISTHDDALEEIFRDKLKLDKTGDLAIRYLNIELAGEYNLKIISRRGTSDSQYKVIVEEMIASAKLGHSVILQTDPGIHFIKQRDDVIQWRFGDEETPIAQVTEESEPSYDSSDERFRNRLEMDPQTGHLIITNITAELTGVYKAKIINSRSRETQYRKYKIAIYVNADRGESVTLYTKSQLQEGCVMKWIFEENTCLIAGKKGVNEPKPTEDERFRGRLKMNPETGDLTIRDIRFTDGGIYTLQQRNNDGKISYRIFHFWVSGNLFQSSDENLHNRTKKNDSTSVEMPLMNEAEDKF